MKKFLQRNFSLDGLPCGCDNNGLMITGDSQSVARMSQQLANQQLANQNANPNSNMIGGCANVQNLEFGNAMPRGLSLQPANVSEWLAVNGYPSARSFTVTVTSTLGVGAIPTTVNLLNQTENGLNNEVDDNGSGPASITYVYPDGNDGRQISLLLRGERLGMGAICIGVAISIATTGVVVPITGNARFVTRGIFSNSDLTLSVDTSPTQFCCPPGSLQFIPLKWNILSTTQLEFEIPGATAATSVASVTFYFPAN